MTSQNPTSSATQLMGTPISSHTPQATLGLQDKHQIRNCKFVANSMDVTNVIFTGNIWAAVISWSLEPMSCVVVLVGESDRCPAPSAMADATGSFTVHLNQGLRSRGTIIILTSLRFALVLQGLDLLS
jgi:hypothetical protein